MDIKSGSWYYRFAFVALVIPFDSSTGLRGQTCSPLFFGLEAARHDVIRPRAAQAAGGLTKRKSSERTRNSKVVQRQQGLRVHPASVGRGRFRTLLGDSVRGV